MKAFIGKLACQILRGIRIETKEEFGGANPVVRRRGQRCTSALQVDPWLDDAGLDFEDMDAISFEVVNAQA